MNEQEKKVCSELDALNRRLVRMVYVLILLLIAGTCLYFLYPYEKKPDLFIKEYSQKINSNISSLSISGECIKKRPVGTYARMLFIIKTAKPIEPRYLSWANIDYARNCFDVDDKTYTFNSYLPYTPGEDVPFYSIIRTTQPRNSIEYSIKVFNQKDSLIYQFPTNGSFQKEQIISLGDKLGIVKDFEFKN